MKNAFSFTFLACVLATAGTLMAQVPRQISYQGVLTDANGNIVADGNHQLTLTVYDAATGGTALFNETHNVPVVRGIFNAIIGSNTPIPPSITFNRAYFLGVAVDGGAELSPRTAMTAAPYAIYASSARYADSSRRAGVADVANGVTPGATGVVTAINGQAGGIQLVGAGTTTISSSGNQFTISSASDNTGIKEVHNTNGTIAVTNPQGPSVTIGVPAGAIGARELAENSVGSLAIRDGSITPQKIANAAFEEPKIAPGAVTTGKISDGAVVTAKLADNSVTSPKIVDGGVATVDIANGAVTMAKINTTGALNGQALIFDGTNLKYTFPTAGQLTVPYAQTAADANPLFSMTNSGNGGGGSFTSTGSGVALLGTASGTGTGVRGVNSGSSGRAGYFQNTSPVNNSTVLEAASSGLLGNAVLASAVGGAGVSATSSSGAGVSATSTSGAGVKATSTSGDGLSGASTSGSGVNATSTSGRAGFFTITNTGNALPAIEATTAGAGNGLTATSTSGFGVVGNGPAKAGVIGTIGSSFSYFGSSGVGGYSSGGFGVSGLSSSGYAVLGYSLGGALAGYFIGNVTIQGDLSITGNISKGGGSFKIDHPLDPANKYLYHSFVESPDMMNIYNGNTVLDAHGSAEIMLPEWFETLNRDFRYQLTAVGAPGPNLFIAEKIEGNRFRIAGGAPGMEVSWQVTGIRHDPYADAHRIQVEVEKPAGERGRFLYPELYGKPVEQGIWYLPPPTHVDLRTPNN